MRLATIRSDGQTRAVKLDAERGAVDLGYKDLAEVLQRPDWRHYTASKHGPRYDAGQLDYAPVVVAPEKIICVGLNYRKHILEMGRELPEFPTLFAKYSRALIGAYDDVVLPATSVAVDWEAELAVIIGAPARNVSAERAHQVIAGFTVINDVTCRDWQYRTAQWLQGKSFEATTPIGPWLVTSDDDEAIAREISCEVNGEVVQSANTADLVFSPTDLVAYLSTIVTLMPGDVIATGTPGGVGHARKPPRYLDEGAELRTLIDGIGECRNRCRREK
jgi:acylpyruvate hydrolase